MKIDFVNREGTAHGRTGAIIAFIIAMAFVLVSCATMTKGERDLAKELIVKAATARVLAEKPQWKDDTVRITGVALTFMVTETEVTVERLEEFVIEQIKWDDLTLEEKAMIVMLMATVREDLQRYIKERGGDQSELRVRVAEVLGWINQTARAAPGK